jgi:choline dehydrogenase-like flavoprotein
VFSYENLLVCDGSAIPANPGVNPSLTITALAEHMLSKIEPKPGAQPVAPVRNTWEVPRARHSIVPASPEAAAIEAAIDADGAGRGLRR